LSYWALTKKTSWLTKFIEEKCPDIIKKYSYRQEVTESPNNDTKIWVYWGQGMAEMPTLVKACYKQLISHYDNVILVTNENISNYINLNAELIRRVETGGLSWAHLSDIIRNKLLYRYGGLWLDSTVWTTDSIPFDKLKKMSFFSANGKIIPNRRSIYFWTSADYNWSTWCMWANKPGFPLFGFVSDAMECIALSDKTWPDYVFQDFLIYYAISHNPEIKQWMEAIKAIPCLHRNTLATLMDKEFDKTLYNELCKTDFVFKLSYRSSWHPLTPNGNTSFYGLLITHNK